MPDEQAYLIKLNDTAWALLTPDHLYQDEWEHIQDAWKRSGVSGLELLIFTNTRPSKNTEVFALDVPITPESFEVIKDAA